MQLSLHGNIQMHIRVSNFGLPKEKHPDDSRVHFIFVDHFVDQWAENICCLCQENFKNFITLTSSSVALSHILSRQKALRLATLSFPPFTILSVYQWTETFLAAFYCLRSKEKKKKTNELKSHIVAYHNGDDLFCSSIWRWFNVFLWTFSAPREWRIVNISGHSKANGFLSILRIVGWQFKPQFKRMMSLKS